MCGGLGVSCRFRPGTCLWLPWYVNFEESLLSCLLVGCFYCVPALSESCPTPPMGGWSYQRSHQLRGSGRWAICHLLACKEPSSLPIDESCPKEYVLLYHGVSTHASLFLQFCGRVDHSCVERWAARSSSCSRGDESRPAIAMLGLMAVSLPREWLHAPTGSPILRIGLSRLSAFSRPELIPVSNLPGLLHIPAPSIGCHDSRDRQFSGQRAFLELESS